MLAVFIGDIFKEEVIGKMDNFAYYSPVEPLRGDARVLFEGHHHSFGGFIAYAIIKKMSY